MFCIRVNDIILFVKIYIWKKNYWDVLISLKLINGICLFFFLEWNKY